MTDYKTRIMALVPPPDTDERRRFLIALSEATRDILVEHAGGDRDNALTGFTLLSKQTWTKPRSVN